MGPEEGGEGGRPPAGAAAWPALARLSSATATTCLCLRAMSDGVSPDASGARALEHPP
jgi:hypothetical protein